jgi:transcriptional regulator with XRE-family HTH domain
VDHRRLFAKRLRRLREAAQLSLDKAGEKGGLSGKYWGEVERGEKSPTHEMMLRMAKALNIPMEGLVRTEREESDEKLLRKRIDSILDKSPTKHLKRVYFYLLDTLEGRSEWDF